MSDLSKNGQKNNFLKDKVQYIYFSQAKTQMQHFSSIQSFLLLNLLFNTGLLAAEVGGDFFDFLDLEPVAVGDFMRFTPF